MGWARPASPGGAGGTTCWPLPPASCTRGHRRADTPRHRKTGLPAISCLPGAHVLMCRGSRNKGRFRAGRSLTGERGLQSDRPGRPHRQARARYWEAGQGPRLGAWSGCGGAPAWKNRATLRCPAAAAGRSSRGRPGGSDHQHLRGLQVAALDGGAPAAATDPRARHSLLGPAFILGRGPRVHQRRDGAQSGLGPSGWGSARVGRLGPTGLLPPTLEAPM